MGVVGLITKALQLLCLYMEFKIKRSSIDAVEDTNKRIDQLEKDINKARKRGDHIGADRMLEQQAHASSFREWLPNLEQRAELYGSKGLRTSGRGNDNKEKPTDP